MASWLLWLLLLWRRVQMREAKAKAEAEAEESGEEVTQEFRPYTWRFSAPGLVFPGDSLEAAEYDLKNLQTYDGEEGQEQLVCVRGGGGGGRFVSWGSESGAWGGGGSGCAGLYVRAWACT